MVTKKKTNKSKRTNKKKKQAHFYDRAYKEFFSNRIVYEQFMIFFTPFKWRDKIHFSKTEIVNTSFISKNYQKKQSDILYKFTTSYTDSGSGKEKKQETFLYVLIEFQSRIDKWMPLRMLLYLANCYEFILRMLRKEAKETKEKINYLPVVIPIVLYRGDRKWNISLKFQDIIDIFDRGLRRFIPDFEYFLLDIQRFDKDNLKKLENLIGSFFALESDRDLASIEETAKEAVAILEEEEQVQMLFNFLFRRLEHQGIDIPSSLVRVINEKEKIMGWTEVIAREIKQNRREGKVEGKVETRIENANSMIADGMDIKLIAKYSGLTVNEVKKLKKPKKDDNH
ncbi:MAG: Rpn family recombination-promoting nuclease/putative transposase [bacterium]|nr:Rpn family recombination-promoting nuclease/putative transposase [bacterium]